MSFDDYKPAPMIKGKGWPAPPDPPASTARTPRDMKSLLSDLAGDVGHEPEPIEDRLFGPFFIFWPFENGGIQLRVDPREFESTPNATYNYLVAAYREIRATRGDRPVAPRRRHSWEPRTTNEGDHRIVCSHCGDDQPDEVDNELPRYCPEVKP